MNTHISILVMIVVTCPHLLVSTNSMYINFALLCLVDCEPIQVARRVVTSYTVYDQIGGQAANVSIS